VDGETRESGTTTELTVEGFGTVSSVGDLRATFGDSTAIILRVRNTMSSAIVTVAIPPALAPGAIVVGLQLLKAGSAVREARSSFLYYKPAPAISILPKWCPVCFEGRMACIVNGRCGDGTIPLEGRMPISGQGVITVYIDNLPVLPFDAATGELSSGWSITAFGSGSTMRRVAYSQKLQTAIEFSSPRLFSPGEREHILRVITGETPTTVPVKLAHFDSSIVVTCQLCAAPSRASRAILVNVTNMMVAEDQQVTDLLSVRFGTMPAHSVTLMSSDMKVTSLVVMPPEYVCSQCVYVRGEARVLLTVSSKEGVTRAASSPFSFFSPPAIVSCRFDTKGTNLIILFDQPTNRAGMLFTDSDCSRLFTNRSLALFGTNPRCVWQSTSDSLTVGLGFSSTLLPGTSVSLLPGVLRSSNGVAVASDLSAAVQLPAIIARPIVTLAGATVIDACSDLRLEALATSPRPLRFVWSADDADLDAQLKSVSASIVYLPYPTSLMQPDKRYIIRYMKLLRSICISKCNALSCFDYCAPKICFGFRLVLNSFSFLTLVLEYALSFRFLKLVFHCLVTCLWTQL
jgi:hypothetical protein